MNKKTPNTTTGDIQTQELKRLENVKKRIKRSTPRFRRSNSWRFIKLKRSSWRRPVGIDNKMREKKRGWPKLVNIGYRTPRKLRSRHPSSLEEVIVNNPHNLELINPQTQAIRISSSVGRKKRQQIAETADIIGIHIFNSKYAPTEALELGEEVLEDLEADELELDTLSAEDLEFDQEQEPKEEPSPEEDQESAQEQEEEPDEE